MSQNEEAIELGRLLDSSFSFEEHSSDSGKIEDLAHSLGKGISEEKASDGRNKKSGHTPYGLRRSFLLALLVILAALIAALEILYHLSSENHGITTSIQKRHYLWTYGPTAIFTILAVFWGNLEYHTRLLMPWKLLSDNPQSAKHSLLLDYVSANSILMLWTSLKAKHYPVFVAALGTQLITLITVVSTSLFVLQPTLVEHTNAQMLLKSQFDGDSFNSSGVDATPVLAISSILSGNLSITYPANTNQQYAVEPFEIPPGFSGMYVLDMISFRYADFSQGSEVARSARVRAFSADLNCYPGNSNATVVLQTSECMISANFSDPSCSTGFLNVGSAPYWYNTSVSMTFGMTQLQDCAQGGSDPGSNRLVIAFGQADLPASVTPCDTEPSVIDNFTSSVLFCEPVYDIEEALVSVDPSGSLTAVVLQGNRTTISTSAWDLAVAFNNSLTISNQVFVDNNMIAVTAGASGAKPNYDYFFNVLRSIWFQEPVEKYFDPQVLEQDSRQLFDASCAQIANQLLESSSSGMTTGNYSATELRLLLHGPSLRIMEAGIAAIMVCVTVIVFVRPTVQPLGHLPNLGRVGVVLASSKELRNKIHQTGTRSATELEQLLSEDAYALRSLTINGVSTIGIEVFRSEAHTILKESDGTLPRWSPVALSTVMKALVLTLPLSIIAALEVSYRVSDSSHGFGDVPASGYLHYTWTMIPALLMTITKLAQDSLLSSVNLLDPYLALSEGNAHAKATLFQDYLSQNAVQRCYQSMNNLRLSVFALALSSLLTPFLTIAIWSQAALSAANILVDEIIPYPGGTYNNNLVFPELVLPTNGSSNSGSQSSFNASSIVAEVQAIRPNMACNVVDSSKFVYKSDARLLNFTHADLMGCNCTSIYGFNDPSCDSLIPTWGISLNPNETTFSETFEIPWNGVKRMNASGWSDSTILTDAIASGPLQCPNVTLVYGNWSKNSITDISGIMCYFSVENVTLNVTYDLSTQAVTAVSPGNSTTIPDHSYWYPFGNPGDINDFLAAGNTTQYDKLFTAASNGSDPSTFFTSANADTLAERVSQIYETFVTQYYNDILRNKNAMTAQAKAYLVDSGRQRLFQSEISTRILEGLLAMIWLCSVIAFMLFDNKNILPKNPCSIAAQASLLADSDLLDFIPPTTARCSDRELMRMTPFSDHVFGMGWWSNGDGTRWFGVGFGKADAELREKHEGTDQQDTGYGNEKNWWRRLSRKMRFSKSNDRGN